jgi:pilus assembly protein FimV
MSISREVAAARNVSLAQAMVGLYRTNPGAFVGGDMSQLLVGAELRVPDRAAFTATSRAAAFREVQERLGIWGGAPAAVAEAGPPEVARPAPAATPESTAAESTPPDAASLQAELATQQAKVAELEAALEAARAELATSIPASTTPPSPLEQRLGNLWWLWGVALAVIAFLAILLRGQSRRAAMAEEEARTADAALVRAHRELQGLRPEEPSFSSDSMASASMAPSALGDESSSTDEPLAADTFVQTLAERAPTDVIRAEPESNVSFDEVMSATADDLEGDPPPIEEAGSMIDLARAYIEMGDYNAAMTELQLALKNGNEAQRAEALRLLDSLPKS